MKPWRDTKRKQCYFQLDSQSYSPNVHAASLAAQSCPTLCDPMNCSPPGSSVHGILRQEYWSGLPCPRSGFTY